MSGLLRNSTFCFHCRRVWTFEMLSSLSVFSFSILHNWRGHKIPKRAMKGEQRSDFFVMKEIFFLLLHCLYCFYFETDPSLNSSVLLHFWNTCLLESIKSKSLFSFIFFSDCQPAVSVVWSTEYYCNSKTAAICLSSSIVSFLLGVYSNIQHTVLKSKSCLWSQDRIRRWLLQ